LNFETGRIIFVSEKKDLAEITKYTETELVNLLKQHDEQAFSYLYDNYAAALNGVIFRMTNNMALSEDILQETFIRIWNNLDRYDATKGKLFTWLINIARNLTIDTLRSKGYKKQLQISTDENTVSNVQAFSVSVAQYDSIGLRKQLEQLRPEQKKIIDLAYFEGYTQDEIARETGVPLGTVKTRMRSAITALRTILGNQ
jgi:RNA polymerase sigma factor (sigma-70 family)